MTVGERGLGHVAWIAGLARNDSFCGSAMILGMQKIRLLMVGVVLLAAFEATAAELFVAPPVAQRNPLISAQLMQPQGAEGATAVVLNAQALAAMGPNDEATFTLPNGKASYALAFERLETAASGSVTWVGHLKDHGTSYRAVLTSGAVGMDGTAAAFGRILTPEGEFQLGSVGNRQTLVDTFAANWQSRIGSHGDARVPPITAGLLAAQAARAQSASPAPSALLAQSAAPSPVSTIDLMVLYTPGLVTRLGTAAAVQTRIDNLVALSNQAYVDSEVAIRLRLVRTDLVNYNDTTDIAATLDALTSGSDPAFTGVAAMRNTYGADLVSLMRAYQGATECGIAWTGGSQGTPMASYARYGYSVVANGFANGFFCSDYTLAHELGHNMGSVHDRVTEAQPTGPSKGAYSYSFGYGMSNGFSSIMAYSSSFTQAPQIGRFSNPNQSNCKGMPCGVSELAANSANNALSLNNARMAVAAFRAAALASVAGKTLDVRTYVPAASAATGYVSYVRVINIGQVPISVTAAWVDPVTGIASAPQPLIANLAVNAAQTLTAAQVEAAAGTVPAGQRPRLRLVASSEGDIRVQSFLLQPNGVFNEVSGSEGAAASVTLRTYVPAAVMSSGYTTYVRVINTGGTDSPITVAKVDAATGLVGAPRILLANLAAGAAQTLTATQVEAALGLAIPANERPRLQIAATGTTLEAQSFLLQPGGAFSQLSTGKVGSTVDVASYTPAATVGFTGFVRMINTSASTTPVYGAFINATSGAVGSTSVLVDSLAAGGSITLAAADIESKLGVSPSANDRPRLRVSAPGATLDVQSFMLQPGGGFDEVSQSLMGTGVTVRTYVPQADAGSGYVSYLRITNTGTTATPVTVALVDGTTGTKGPVGTLTTALAAGATQAFSASQIEAALGSPIPAGSRPRIAVGSNTVLEVQSYLTQPGGAVTEVSGGQ